MKKLKRALGLICLFLLICPMCLSFVSAEEFDTPVHEDPPIDLQYIRQADCDLFIPGTSATIYSFVKGTPGLTTKCEIDLSLQKKTLSGWDPVATWVKIENSWRASLNPSRAVVSGQTYRAVAVVTVWNGSNSETITVTSGSVKAP